MRFVVDSNVLFTFFWKKSVFREICEKQQKLLSPEYALEEINKHSKEIMKKANLSKQEFKKLKAELAVKIIFIPQKEYARSLKKARSILSEEHEEIMEDIDFFALAIEFNCPIWSNDKLLKKQKEIPVFDTADIIEIIEF